MAPCTSSFRWDEPYYKVPPDYSSEVKFGMDYGYGCATTSTSDGGCLTASGIMDAMQAAQKRANEMYNQQIEREQLRTNPIQRMVKIEKRDFSDMVMGVWPTEEKIQLKQLPPYKIQLLKYRIKYLRIAHPELESWCTMHDINGMEAGELYKLLKSKI